MKESLKRILDRMRKQQTGKAGDNTHGITRNGSLVSDQLPGKVLKSV